MEEEIVIQSSCKFVVYRERCRKNRTIGLIRWQRTSGCSISEKLRDVLEVADVKIVVDGMDVVEMKGIMKMI